MSRAASAVKAVKAGQVGAPVRVALRERRQSIAKQNQAAGGVQVRMGASAKTAIPDFQALADMLATRT